MHGNGCYAYSVENKKLLKGAAFSVAPIIKGEHEMTEITLNIYKATNKNEIEKTYTTKGYKLMYGTVKDFLSVIDLDKIHDNSEVAKMIMQSYDQIEPLILDIFPDLLEEELRRTGVDDIIGVIIQTGKAVAENLGLLKGKGKN